VFQGTHPTPSSSPVTLVSVSSQATPRQVSSQDPDPHVHKHPSKPVESVCSIRNTHSSFRTKGPVVGVTRLPPAVSRRHAARCPRLAALQSRRGSSVGPMKVRLNVEQARTPRRLVLRDSREAQGPLLQRAGATSCPCDLHCSILRDARSSGLLLLTEPPRESELRPVPPRTKKGT